MQTSPVLLSSTRVAAFSPERESAYMQAALAENAFARLNYEALIGDGRKANYDTQLASVMSPAAYTAMCARLERAGAHARPRTYGEAFTAVVDFGSGEARIDQDLLLAIGILAPGLSAERLRDVLRFEVGASAVHERRVSDNAAFGAKTMAVPRARPLGWTTLGAPASTTDSGQPTRSGWYLRVRLAWPDRKFPKPVGSHSAFGYYDADSKRWGITSSLDYEYAPESVPTPGIGGEMELESNVHKLTFYPVTMGPVARARGVTPAQFNELMKHDVMGFEAHYRTLAKVGSPTRQIFYQFVPSLSSSRIDGNCNTYASYLLKSLGVREPYPHGGGRLGTVGSEVIGRNADGDVVIYGNGDTAKAAMLTGNAPPRAGLLDVVSAGLENLAGIARAATARRP